MIKLLLSYRIESFFHTGEPQAGRLLTWLQQALLRVDVAMGIQTGFQFVLGLQSTHSFTKAYAIRETWVKYHHISVIWHNIPCDKPPSTCDIPPYTCNLPPNTCDIPPYACDIPPYTCDLPPNTCDIPPYDCDIPPYACDIPPIEIQFCYMACWVGFIHGVNQSLIATCHTCACVIPPSSCEILLPMLWCGPSNPFCVQANSITTEYTFDLVSEPNVGPIKLRRTKLDGTSTILLKL
jgi:hypothetical protein